MPPNWSVLEDAVTCEGSPMKEASTETDTQWIPGTTKWGFGRSMDLVLIICYGVGQLDPPGIDFDFGFFEQTLHGKTGQKIATPLTTFQPPPKGDRHFILPVIKTSCSA